MKPTIRSLTVLIIAIVAMLVLCETVSAQEPITRTLSSEIKSGLDLTFLIDNSTSMYAKVDECTGEVIDMDAGNDEEMLRLDSVRHVIRRLLLYNLRLHKEVEHRVGVITFGGPGTSTIDVRLESLRTDSEEAMDRRFEYLAGKLSTDQRGDTHPREAFQKAAEMWATAASTEAPQVKAVIVLTDGRPHIGMTPSGILPCVEGEPNPEFDKEYFAWLGELIEEEFPVTTESGSTEGYHIWVVAMNEDWEDIRPYWEDIIGNRWRRISSASQIPGTFNDILEQIYPLASILIKPSFCVPPYLDSAAFSVFASEPIAATEVITFYRQDGSQLLPSDPDVRLYEEIGESIVWIEVRRPEPGVWRYQTQPDRTVQVRFDPMLGQMEMIEPGGIQSQLSSARLAFQLYDLNGSPMKEHQGFPLILEGTVSPPGTTQPLPLAFDPEGEGRYVSQEEIPLHLKGEYLVGIEGYAIDSCNEKWIVVPSQTHKFIVGPVEAHFLPPDGSVTPVTAVTSEFELRGPDNEPVEVTAEVQDEVVMKAWLYPAGSDPLDGTELEIKHQDGARFVATREVCGLPEKEHRIKVQGWLETDGGKPIDLFTVDEKAFTVTELTADLSSPAGTQQPFRPVEVLYQLSDTDPCTDVHVRLHVTTPSGRSRTIDMKHAENGHFSASLFLDEAARQPYALEAEGWLMTPEGRMDLFRTTDSIIADTLHLALTKPAAGECPPEKTKVKLEFELRTGSGDLFKPHPSHPIDFSSSYVEHLDSGATQPLWLSLTSPGLLTGQLVPDRWGEWQVHAVGLVTDPENNVIEAVSAEEEFCIMDVVPLSLTIASPSPGEEVPLRANPRAWPLFTGHPTPVDFLVQFVDVEKNNKPVSYTRLTSIDLSQVLVSTLFGPNDSDLSSELVFAVDSDDPTLAKANSDSLIQEGTYTLTVAIQPDAVPNEGYVWAAGAEDGVEVNFSRKDVHRGIGTLLSVAQGTAGAGALVAAVILALLFTAPMKGSLIFMTPGGQTIGTPIKLPKHRWATLKGKRIPDAVRRMGGIGKLRVSNAGGDLAISYKDGKTIIEPGRIGRVGKLQAKYEAPAKAGPTRPWRRPVRRRSRRPPR